MSGINHLDSALLKSKSYVSGINRMDSALLKSESDVSGIYCMEYSASVKCF